jgi:hypothetical protein
MERPILLIRACYSLYPIFRSPFENVRIVVLSARVLESFVCQKSESMCLLFAGLAA